MPMIISTYGWWLCSACFNSRSVIIVTSQAFSVQAQCFIDQYGNYTVPELIPVLGEEDAHVRKCFSENILKIFGKYFSWMAETRRARILQTMAASTRRSGPTPGLSRASARSPLCRASPSSRKEMFYKKYFGNILEIFQQPADVVHLVRPGLVRDTNTGVSPGSGSLRPPLSWQVQGHRTSGQLWRLPEGILLPCWCWHEQTGKMQTVVIWTPPVVFWPLK